MRRIAIAALLLAFAFVVSSAEADGPPLSEPGEVKLPSDPWKLTARSRVPVKGDENLTEVVETPVAWAPNETAIVICDMWDHHWCKSAERRTGEVAPRIDALAKAVRAGGGLVIHAPSDVMKFYEGTPQRERARNAPKVAPPSPPNRLGGPPLPIDDKDNGCDDEPMCPIPDGKKVPYPWTRQIAAIEVAPEDAVTDKGDEVYNLIQARGIKHLLVCGVHTNMCILHRSFAIKQMTRWGVDTMLVRDCTDSMYNPRRSPFVSHAKGTELVIGYIERNWCQSVTSGQILRDQKPQKVVLISAEQEYDAKTTLPAFAKAELEPLGFATQHLNSDDVKKIDGLEALKDADVLVVFVRRRELPPEQLAVFKAWCEAGKPVVAIRTASHGFQTWLDFDKDVLGGHYGNHYGKGEPTKVSVIEKAATHPLLRGVTPTAWASSGSLYKNTPLAESATPLLTGTFQSKPAEPVAWTHAYKGGRVFYTSLGHADDFGTPQFKALLRNAILWAADRQLPAK